MSTQPTVTDNEMQYFQFKARQLYQLCKEDHNWNEFCKSITCTCCSCQPANQFKTTKEIAVQASRNVPSSFGRNANTVTGVQSRILPQALNEIKTKLDRIDLALSGMQMPAKQEQIANRLVPQVILQNSIGSVNALQNPMNEKRIQVIQNSLKLSLQRLQSSALWKNPRPPVNVKKKNSGFFVSHELQKQRTIARNAYLASLAKPRIKPEASHSGIKEVFPSKQSSIHHKVQQPKAIPKNRKETILKLKTEKNVEETAVVSNQLTETKDKNIESAVDGIVDDLMGETVLLLHKIKQVKSGKSIIRNNNGQKTNSVLSPKPNLQEELSVMQDTVAKTPPLKNWDKIRQNLFNLKDQLEQKTDIHDLRKCSSHQIFSKNKSESEKDEGSSSNDILQSIPPSQSTAHETILLKNPLPSSDSIKRELHIDPQSAQKTAKHRREYMKYLERISRTKKGHFDPWTLSNMIAESLLDECIDEVSQELQDVPASLVTDLYDQEFLQSV